MMTHLRIVLALGIVMAIRPGWLLSQEPAAPAAQAPAAAKPAGPDDVVATVDGEKLTPRKIQQIRASFPANYQQAIARMDNRAFVKTYGELKYLARLAEEEKLTERAPYKDQFAVLKQNFLAQAYLDSIKSSVPVSNEEVKKYYDEHKVEFEEAIARAIYIAFSPNAGKPSADPKARKLLTEQQAKTKAEALVAQLKKGADFAKLAKENSDDAPSAEKGGELGPIKKNAAGIPEELKAVIFGLQPGQVSDSVRQPAGFYIFKLEKIAATPYSDVVASLMATVQGMKVQAEFLKLLSAVKITYDNEPFFAQPYDPKGPGAPPAIPPPAPKL